MHDSGTGEGFVFASFDFVSAEAKIVKFQVKTTMH